MRVSEEKLLLIAEQRKLTKSQQLYYDRLLAEK